ncbi:hypothetical protein Bca52824_050621 [Brassica carinata]|uniref:Uncharacterized protein n=1 Tax=Brassica carinata TaxID=52824 RepID=A0A8X7R0C1_BRACI|nr:hypothetical protein Bca52824_050621 [Brassica carinata]
MSQMITNPSLRAHQTMVTIKAITQNKLSLSAAEGKCFAAARCVASGSGICGGEANGGIWELLECLEKEAIMGDDDGRDPKDYNRRAKNRENTLQSKEYCCLFHLFV